MRRPRKEWARPCLQSFQNLLKCWPLLCVSVPALCHQLHKGLGHVLWNGGPAAHEYLEEHLHRPFKLLTLANAQSLSHKTLTSANIDECFTQVSL